MRAFISLDLEGLPHVVSREHLFVKGALYAEARKIATEVVMAVARTLHDELGVDEVVVADSHGPMVNILVEEMPGYVKLTRGFPRPLSMVAGGKGADFAMFLGYHAKAGTAGATFDHTYSGATVDSLEVNGVEVSEALLNAYLLGEWGVPVAMVAGDKALIESDVKNHLPWAVGIPIKESFGRYSAMSPGMESVKELLRQGTIEAFRRLERGEVKPLKTKTPVEVKLRFLNSAHAEVAELLPFVERVDGKTVRFEAKSVEEVYKIFEVLVFAAAGITSIVNR
ncbi:peptide transporter [Thermococcus guaymasensis DSM 11113]|uniref:Peptide transporter n=1 Tax=Thermococcus guaymasensis DSM 11113 TaxID=1432656 RepID=A0A0X1KM58_9EURY|nr:M55 family metallopeptidase [Thermococcus guaymasensis]AJC72361.1 peptide transporter [Thermococcus guaymasensis DSM 11113]